MSKYSSMSTYTLESELERLNMEFETVKSQSYALNMARGKPSGKQLDLSMPMLDIVNSKSDYCSEGGIDCRNYGELSGIPEAKALMADLVDDDPDNVIVYGSSSLAIMYDTVARLWIFGARGYTPWSKLPSVKWICPVPGYDRHFGICDTFGIEMIPVPMDENGPVMDIVEELCANDDSIKGIWCVPKYSNPTGITYSDEVVDRLASMKAAGDFRIFWDNAYAVHHLYDNPEDQAQLKGIADACIAAGNPDRYYKFASTSKITFSGAGLAVYASSPANVSEMLKRISARTIGYDKLNQLRHARFLVNGEGIAEIMKDHAAILRPRFEAVQKAFNKGGLADCGCTWTNPRGGYFVSFDSPKGTAKRIVSLCKEAGVILTKAGATWPHGEDPNDTNIRIAPSFPPLGELKAALKIFVLCTHIACVEVELASRK